MPANSEPDNPLPNGSIAGPLCRLHRNVFPHSIAISQGVWLLGMLCWVVRLCVYPRPRLYRTPLDYVPSASSSSVVFGLILLCANRFNRQDACGQLACIRLLVAEHPVANGVAAGTRTDVSCIPLCF
jgi:hypothetical protein